MRLIKRKESLTKNARGHDLVLQLSLLLIVRFTHHLTTCSPAAGILGAETESVLGLLVALHFPPSLPPLLLLGRQVETVSQMQLFSGLGSGRCAIQRDGTDSPVWSLRSMLSQREPRGWGRVGE